MSFIMWSSGNNEPVLRPQDITPGIRRALGVGLFICTSAFVSIGVIGFDLGNVASENNIWPHSLGDCPPGWQGAPASPRKLINGFEQVYPQVVVAANAAASTDPSGMSRDESQRAHDLSMAYSSLEHRYRFYTEEAFVEPKDAVCVQDDGQRVVNEEAQRSLEDLDAAGYGIDPMTGQTITP